MNNNCLQDLNYIRVCMSRAFNNFFLILWVLCFRYHCKVRYSAPKETRRFLDLHNNRAFKNSTVSVAQHSQCSAHSNVVLDDLLITVDTTSHLNRCETLMT